MQEVFSVGKVAKKEGKLVVEEQLKNMNLEDDMTFLDNYYTNFLDFIYYYTIPIIFLFFILMKNKTIYERIYLFILSEYIKYLEEKILLRTERIEVVSKKKFFLYQTIQRIMIFLITKASFLLNKSDKELFNKIYNLSYDEFKLFYDIQQKMGFAEKEIFGSTYGIYLFKLSNKQGFIGFIHNAPEDNFYYVYNRLEKDIEVLEQLSLKKIIFFDKGKQLTVKNDKFIYFDDISKYPPIRNESGKMIGFNKQKSDGEKSFYYVELNEYGKTLKLILDYNIRRGIKKTLKNYNQKVKSKK